MVITQIRMDTTTMVQPEQQQQQHEEEVQVEDQSELSFIVRQLQTQLFEMCRQHAQEMSFL